MRKLATFPPIVLPILKQEEGLGPQLPAQGQPWRSLSPWCPVRPALHASHQVNVTVWMMKFVISLLKMQSQQEQWQEKLLSLQVFLSRRTERNLTSCVLETRELKACVGLRESSSLYSLPCIEHKSKDRC